MHFYLYTIMNAAKMTKIVNKGIVKEDGLYGTLIL